MWTKAESNTETFYSTRRECVAVIGLMHLMGYLFKVLGSIPINHNKQEFTGLNFLVYALFITSKSIVLSL